MTLQLDSPHSATPLALTPEASLNRLPVRLASGPARPARRWVSTQALHSLMLAEDPAEERSVRQFLRTFDPDRPADARILAEFGERLSRVLDTAVRARHWAAGSPFQRRYARHWRACRTLVLAGGLTSGAFGRALVTQLAPRLADRDLVLSPWGGQTGLMGLARHLDRPGPVLVMDFGATGIKRGIACDGGTRLDSLPELLVDHWLDGDGLFRAEALRAVLADSAALVEPALPVAISLACYLRDGHPFDYRSGVYHRLVDDCDHLATALHRDWLPAAGFSGLALLAHDSSAAALAFRFREPAMTVTLGTGLGVGVCPWG